MIDLELFQFEVILLTLLILASYVYSSTRLFYLSSLLLTGLLYFNRKPNLSNLSNKDIIAPCDGEIISVKKIDNIPYYEIVFFLNINDIHYQYAPYSGKVINQIEEYGHFKPANLPISRDNYRITTLLQTKIGLVILQQISGFLVRQIKSFVKPGQSLKTGDPIGMIKFGSRCQLYLPSDRLILKIKERDKVKIGQTIAYIL